MKTYILYILILIATMPIYSQQVGIGTNNPLEKLDVNGAIKIGTSSNTNAGAIRWSGTDFEGYTGTEWVSLTKSNQMKWGNYSGNVQTSNQEIPSNITNGNEFGKAVSIDGDYAVIGAPSFNVGLNAYQGSVFIYKKIGTNWLLDTMLIASDGGPFEYFGTSVSISHNYIVVGTPDDNISGAYYQGSAYVYKRTGNIWGQEIKLLANDGVNHDFFGTRVAIDSNYIAIGAPRDAIGSNYNQGSVYIFKNNGTSWLQESKILASDGHTGAYFGNSVSIFENYLIVGAPYENIGGNSNQGSAYIFKRTGTNWNEQIKLIDSVGGSFDFYAISVDINSDYAVIGSVGKDILLNVPQGAVFVYKRNGNIWSLDIVIHTNDGEAGDRFGKSVSIDGNYIVVGAYRDDIGINNDFGSTYIFKKSGTNWLLDAKVIALDGEAYDYFGESVSISRDNIIIGASGVDVGGAVYFIEK